MLTTGGIDTVIEAFSDIQAFEAVECLCTIFKVPTAWVQVDGTLGQLSGLYDRSEIYTNLLASKFPLSFFGGPPGQVKSYKGTLLTLLVDHFLYAFLRNQKQRLAEALQYVQMQHTE